ncbi:MAG: glycosyltransferase [Thermoplasmatales archaeon]
MQRSQGTANLVCIMVLYNFEPDTSEIFAAIESGELGYAIFIDNSTQQEYVDVIFKTPLDPFIKSRIIYIRNQSNLGLSKALNLGLLEAKKIKAEYILILDQDAVLIKNYFRIMYTNFKSISEFERKLYIMGPIVSNCMNDLGKTLGFRARFSKVESVINSGMFFKLEIVNKIGKFDENLFLGSIDHEFSQRILQNGGKIFRLNMVTICQDFGKSIKANNIIGRILGFYFRFFSYIMVGLDKTNEFQHFAVYYPYGQLKLNLYDSIKYQQNQKPNIFRITTSKVARLIIEKFGDTK